MKSKFSVYLLCLLAALAIGGCANGLSFGKSGMDKDKGKSEAQRDLEKNPDDRKAKVKVMYERYRQINQKFADADAAYAAGNTELARTQLNEVLQLDPGNPRALASLQRLDTAVKHAELITQAKKLIQQADADGAYKLLRQVLIEDPKNTEALALSHDIEAKLSRDAITPRKLKPKGSGTVSLEFRDANLRNIFEVISRTSGINIILDPNVRSDLKASVFVKDASVEEVIDFLLTMHQLSKKVLTDNSILIYPNNKAAQYEDLILRTFYLNHADAKQTASLVKAMLPIKDVFVDEKLNMISLKATYDQIQDVEKLIINEDLPDPEVVLDVEILEIRRTRLTDIGIAFPDTFSLLSGRATRSTGTGTTGSVTGSITDNGTGTGGDGSAGGDNSALTLSDFSGINRSRIGVSPGLLIRLLRQDGDSNLLANPRIRVKNREKAKIHIGDKIPIPVTTIGAGNNSFIGQSANYLDVGLKLDVEPRVMLNNEVSIRISLEVSNATFFAGSLFPTIGTRNTSTVLMSGDGETQVLAGLISDEDRETTSKVPGLSSLPLIGRLFTKPRNDDAKTEIVLLITPHVVRNLQRPSAADAEFYGGSGGRNSPLNIRPSAVIQQAPAGLQAPPPPPSEAVQPDNLRPELVQPEPARPELVRPEPVQPDTSSVPSPGEYNTGPNVAFPPGTVNPLGKPVGSE